jgi:hypothetical protein
LPKNEKPKKKLLYRFPAGDFLSPQRVFGVESTTKERKGKKDEVVA